MSNFLVNQGNQGTSFKNHGSAGGTSFTLDLQASTNSVLLAVGGVLQEPGVDYTVSGTTITTTSSVTAGIEVYSWVLHKPGTAPVIQDNSVTGGKIALTSQAEGDIMYCNSAGDWVRLAKGTAGQVLKQNSGLTAPEWGTVSSDFVLLSTQTASSSASLDFADFDNATYSSYMFVVENIGPTNDGTYLAVRTSTDGGSTYDASAGNYQYAVVGYNTSGTATTANNASADEIILHAYTAGNAANEHISGTVYLYHAAGTEYTQVSSVMSHGGQDTLIKSGWGAGWRTSAADVDALRFKMNGGNITDGRIKMYGLK